MWICHGCELMNPDHVTVCPRCGRVHAARVSATAAAIGADRRVPVGTDNAGDDTAAEYQPFPSPPAGLDALAPHALGGMRGEPVPAPRGAPVGRAGGSRTPTVEPPRFIASRAVRDDRPAYVPDPGRAGLDSLAQGQVMRYRRAEAFPRPSEPIPLGPPPTPAAPHGEGTPWKAADTSAAVQGTYPSYAPPAQDAYSLADLSMAYTAHVDDSPFEPEEFSRVEDIPVRRSSAAANLFGTLVAFLLLGLAAWLALKYGLMTIGPVHSVLPPTH